MSYVFPIFFFLWLIPCSLLSQLDILHYVPPLHFISNSQIEDHYIYVSTPSATPFALTIEDGAGNILVNTNISNAAPYIYTIGNGQISGSQTFVPVDSLNTVLTHSGLKLHAASPFYVSLRARSNSQAESLTTKGTAALGTEFRYGGFPQFTAGAAAQDRNFTAGIMATEDNTTITIDDYDSGVVFSGTPTVSAPSITVTLNEGECYVVSGDNYVPANLDGFMGAHIVSDKPIVLNNGNLLGNIHPTTTMRDMGMDQSVPVSVIGKEYIVIAGDGVSELERPIIIAHYDNTDVFINGNTTAITTLDAGDYYLVPNTYYQGTNHQNMYIETTNDVYLYQALAGGVSTATGGLNFIPPLDCFLPDTIDFIPNINSIGSVNFNGGVMLFTNQGAVLQINGVTQTGAEAVPSAPWETYKILNLTGNITITSSHTMAAGIYGYSGVAGFAGYFAGFTSMPVNSDFYYVDTCLGMSTEFIGEIDSTTYVDSVVWDFGDPASGASNNSLLGSPVHTYNISGIYTVQLIVYRCENDTIAHTITIQELPSISPVLDQTFCAQSNTTTISFSGSIPGTNYSWINDNAAIGLGLSGSGNIPPFIAANPGSTPLVSNVVVTPEIAGCYGSTDSFSITINQTFDSATDTTVCATELPFDWNGLTFAAAGSQTATLASVVTGCDSLTTLNVTVNPLPFVDAGPDLTLCFGDSALLNMVGTDQYLWNNNIANNTFVPLSLGTNAFYLAALDLNGCQNADTLIVNVLEPPVAALEADVLQGFSILNVNFSNASLNASSYEWDFGNGTSYSVNDLSSQSSDFVDVGYYSVMLIASNGICADTSTITITVDPFEPFINFPNVFTPNDDEINDLFEYNYENIVEFELYILNRWGNLVCHISDVSLFWDGKINNKKAKDGIYFYFYSAKSISDTTITGSGFFTLLR